MQNKYLAIAFLYNHIIVLIITLFCFQLHIVTVFPQLDICHGSLSFYNNSHTFNKNLVYIRMILFTTGSILPDIVHSPSKV